MPTFPSASLILFAESGRTDQLIWQAVQELGKNQWRTEVLIVSDDDTDASTERITYRPVPNRYTSVGQAIRAAKHDLIAIADPGFEFDAAQWQLMAGRIDQTPIQATFTDVVSKSEPQTILPSIALDLRFVCSSVVTNRKERIRSRSDSFFTIRTVTAVG